MEYAAEPNLLLETLSYLGRKASGKTWTDTQNSIHSAIRSLMLSLSAGDKVNAFWKYTLAEA